MRRLLLLAAAGLVACGGTGSNGTGTTTQAVSSSTATRRVLVGFKSGMNTAAVLQRGGSIRSRWDALDAVSAEVPSSAVAKLAADPSVAFVESDRAVSADAAIQGAGEDPWGNLAVRAVQARAQGFTGDAVHVCVIDTGIDDGHPEFARGAGTVFGAGYDFVDADAFPIDAGCNVAGACAWGEGHGTHVTGTIAAQLGAASAASPARLNMAGVAPGVVVHEYRVLGLDGYGTTEAVINGILSCADLPFARRVANLSLGSDEPSQVEQKAFQYAWAKGVLTFAAAGNAGTSALHYPASYPNVVSVAAVDANLQRASFSQYNRQVELAGPGVDVLSALPRGVGRLAAVTVGASTFAAEPVTFTAVGSVTGPVVPCGICDASTACGAQAAPFVALCDRGTITFAEKVQNAQAAGATAVIIANSLRDPPDSAGSFTLGAASATWPPVASISHNSGVAAKALLPAEGTVAITTADYGFLQGTSMATPHVAGCAAVAWAAHPGYANSDLRDLLRATAQDLGKPGRDPEFGFGLVDCLAAATAP
ncbi:S8 family serine peptidase [Anaeromyxobacter paludicola]|uniref:Serine protease n=1 Tax=Anaeromyxobacter paludicola TaxID=2918171 RepID=A0ABN6N9U9_9BACT|nr:S8 family serine peptidase [Anaeromyxobacter paludicola]BDG08790.1 serine protease [Anaeromyxobacter paludicola]